MVDRYRGTPTCSTRTTIEASRDRPARLTRLAAPWFRSGTADIAILEAPGACVRHHMKGGTQDDVCRRPHLHDVPVLSSRGTDTRL
jgi:hypothetical protein